MTELGRVGGCSHVIDLVRRTKPDCPCAMGTHAFSPQRAESFRHFLLLSSPPVVYHSRQVFESGVEHPTLKSQRARFLGWGTRAASCSMATESSKGVLLRNN